MDTVIDTTLGFVLQSLKQIVLHYYDLISGTKDKVDELRNQLGTLKAWVEDTDKKMTGNESKTFQALVRDIRQVASEAEIVIDKHEVAASKQKNRDYPSKAGHFVGYVLDLEDVADKLQKISMRVQDFFQNKANLILDEIPKEDPQKREAPAVMKDSSIMVGLEDEVQKVIKLLHKKKEKLEVVSIVGMPGLGKTRLAIKVKDHPRIGFTFSTRAFVRVSHEYKRREVFLNILHALKPTHEEMNNKSDEDIKVAIHEELKDKLYMIVMDDVWTEDAWNELKDAFPDNEGSKVLLTTRDVKVALHANRSNDSLVRLRDLNDDESKELLRREVFGENSCPPELERYEKEIVSKCGRLPLSIMVIGGILLCNRESTDMWKDVAESVHSYVAKDKKLRDLIGLSYNNLPDHLKPCFLYLGVFRQGSRIPAWKLLQLWIAEGFVEQEEHSRLEVAAKYYLENLVARNLVRVEERRTNGQMKTCSLHDAVRDFCKEEAKRLNLFREISMIGEDSTSLAPTDYYRGLCIHSYVKEYMCKKPSHEYVRSFLSFSQEETSNRVSGEIASFFAKGFEVLRVLDARSIIFPNFPDELLCLVLLRYISISCDSNILPEGVSDLQYLQTVIIRKSQGHLEIKADIWKMSQLRHLDTNVSTRLYCPTAKDEYDVHKICPNIQTLSRISSDSCRSDVLKRTPNIKKLGIRGKLEASLFDSLSRLEFLEDLRLFNEGSRMCALPAASKNFPKRLTKLTLQNTSLDWRYMSILAGIENLEVLKLKDNAFLGEKWGPMKQRFSRLQVLHVGITNLVEWEATLDNFPMLRSLILKGCQKLKGIPSDIGQIMSLQNNYLHYTNKCVAEAALKIKGLKTDLNMPFHLSVLPLKHLDSESTTNDEQSDEQIREENEQRVEALQEIAVPEKKKRHRRVFLKYSNKVFFVFFETPFLSCRPLQFEENIITKT